MKVKFSRCTSSNLAEVPQVDGQLIYTKDTGEVYLDVSNRREKISDVVEIVNKSGVVSPILSKLYYETSTDILYKAKKVNDEIIWVDITGATVSYVQTQIQNAKDYAETYADTNFLKKDNTTAYTPSADYNPSTKKYVDDKVKEYKPLQNFPNGTNTTGTTVQFFNSIKATNPAVGSLYLGLVRLTDMPTGLVQAEVEVEVYNNQVLYATMRSADTAPYVWYSNSFQYRGWQTTQGSPSANSISYDNTTSGMSANNVQSAIDEIHTSIGDINSILDEINGVEV